MSATRLLSTTDGLKLGTMFRFSRCWGFTPASYRYPLMLDSLESRNQRALSSSAGTLQVMLRLRVLPQVAMGFIVAVTGPARTAVCYLPATQGTLAVKGVSPVTTEFFFGGNKYLETPLLRYSRERV